MKSSGLNKSGISPAHLRKQRNLVVGHSEDHVRNAQPDEMQINQFQY